MCATRKVSIQHRLVERSGELQQHKGMSASPSMLPSAALPPHPRPLYFTAPPHTATYDTDLLPHISHPVQFPLYYPLSPPSSLFTTPRIMAQPAPSSPLSAASSFLSSASATDEHNPSSASQTLTTHCCPSSSSTSSSSSSLACLSVSTVPRLLHPFFASSDLLSHSGALFTLSDLLTLSSLNRCIAALARSDRIWRPRIQAAIAIRYPAAAQLTDTDRDERDEKKQQQEQRQQQDEAMLRFTCPYLSAMQRSNRDKAGQSNSLPQLTSTNPFVSDLVQQLEASTAKALEQGESVDTITAHRMPDSHTVGALSSSVTVLSTMAVPLFYSPPSSSHSSVSSLLSKARYIALCQCSLHSIVGCSRLVAPLPPLPAPSTQAHWAHTRVLHYPAPPSLNSCDSLPTLPLCGDCRAALAVCMKHYYDYRGEWAGQFTMTPLSIVIIQPPDVAAATANNERPMAVLDVRYSHIGGYDGIDHRRFEVEYIKAGHSGCTCGCGGMSAGVSPVGEWSVRVMHRYRSGIYAMDSPLNVLSNDRLEYSHLRERDRSTQRKRKSNVLAQPTQPTQSTETLL